jgi:hypothetical protein
VRGHARQFVAVALAAARGHLDKFFQQFGFFALGQVEKGGVAFAEGEEPIAGRAVADERGLEAGSTRLTWAM